MSMSKKIAIFSLAAVLTVGFLLPASRVEAAALTQSQIQAVISLLTAFGVNSSTIATVQAALGGTGVTSSSNAATTATTGSSLIITVNMIGNLHQGDVGEKVKYLQALLAADPSVYPQGLITGYFGAATAQAVKQYQKKHGLSAVGSIGPQTLKKLKSELEDTPIAIVQGTATSTGMICAIVPPGHLIAPGWLKKHPNNGVIVPACQTLPPGIAKKIGTTTPPTTPDTLAPAISGASIGSIASTSANVSWTTNEPASSKVYFGTTTPLSLGSAANIFSATLVTSHALALSGLTASTTYYYVIESKDAADNTATTSQSNFSTTN